MKRSIILEGLDKELELSKAVELNITDDREFIYLEKCKDGKWRLTYTAATIPDIKSLQALRILREDDNGTQESREV